MIHHAIRAAILTGFAMLIVYLFRSGSIELYIASSMELPVKLSALGLYAAGIHQVFAALRSRDGGGQGTSPQACGCGHDHGHDGHAHHDYDHSRDSHAHHGHDHSHDSHAHHDYDHSHDSHAHHGHDHSHDGHTHGFPSSFAQSAIIYGLFLLPLLLGFLVPTGMSDSERAAAKDAGFAETHTTDQKH